VCVCVCVCVCGLQQPTGTTLTFPWDNYVKLSEQVTDTLLRPLTAFVTSRTQDISHVM
jgi:hypothetical protein